MFIKNKQTHVPFIMAAGTEIFWALVYIFIPIYIVKEFQSEGYVGFFLAAVTVPLILFEYFAGKVAVKKGYRKIFMNAYFTLSIICITSLFFIHNPYIILAIFILTSIPMAFTESLVDAFFFSQIKQKDEEKLYPIFTTARSVGGIIGRLSLGLVIGFFSFQAGLILMGILMFILSLVAFMSRFR